MQKSGSKVEALLDSVGCIKLLTRVPLQELEAAIELLEPILDKQETPRYLAGISYLIGIRQGVRQERQRRQQNGKTTR